MTLFFFFFVPPTCCVPTHSNLNHDKNFPRKSIETNYAVKKKKTYLSSIENQYNLQIIKFNCCFFALKETKKQTLSLPPNQIKQRIMTKIYKN